MATKGKKKKKARTWRDILGPGRDPTTSLYRAVVRYVESKGGKLVVVGGIGVLEMPDDRAGMFRVAVKCLGSKPNFEKPTGAPHGK